MYKKKNVILNLSTAEVNNLIKALYQGKGRADMIYHKGHACYDLYDNILNQLSKQGTISNINGIEVFR